MSQIYDIVIIFSVDICEEKNCHGGDDVHVAQ